MARGRTAVAVALAAFASLVTAGCSQQGQSDTMNYELPVSMGGQQFAAHQTVDATVVDDYQPKRDDVVIFKDPGGWLPSGMELDTLVKRVIGVEGDVIECCDAAGRLVVDDKSLDESNYIAKHHGRCAAELPRMALDHNVGRTSPCDWRLGPVPPGTLFVLGDNRRESADSRFHLCSGRGAVCDPWVDAGSVIAVVD